ncbi:hypothetical protein TSAR_009123 [Trichomalopsis sarcophagae]|uniref:Uncharacterized protein n=1 Tax=Trichomalopsis sarcophagae TaxID=543379 RepID=A0A232EKM7_9HYME|nr:hypothetical protein TSAR_009123 [Trichomalopsis sarcophagae]
MGERSNVYKMLVHEYNEYLQRPLRHAAEEEEVEENDENINVKEILSKLLQRLYFYSCSERCRAGTRTEAQPNLPVRRRGRPRQNANASAEEQPAVRRRGRPRRNENIPDNAVVDEPAPRRRGRPRLNQNVPVKENIEEAIEGGIIEHANIQPADIQAGIGEHNAGPIREADEVANEEGQLINEEDIREHVGCG